MYLNLDHIQAVRDEYERQVQQLLLERAVQRARTARTQRLARLVGQGLGLIGTAVLANRRVRPHKLQKESAV